MTTDFMIVVLSGLAGALAHRLDSSPVKPLVRAFRGRFGSRFVRAQYKPECFRKCHPQVHSFCSAASPACQSLINIDRRRRSPSRSIEQRIASASLRPIRPAARFRYRSCSPRSRTSHSRSRKEMASHPNYVKKAACLDTVSWTPINAPIDCDGRGDQEQRLSGHEVRTDAADPARRI